MNPTAQAIPSPQEDLSKTLSEVKKEILFQIINNLKHHDISVEEAQNLAKDFLSLFPVNTKEELFDKIHSLSERYPEAREAYIKFASPYENEKSQRIVVAMQQHIQQGNYQKVLELAKGKI